MSSKSRRRSRAVVDENRADCPFTIAMVATPSYEGQISKKRKRDGPDEDKKELVQASPFEPRGRFKTHSTMDLAYTVEPRKPWLDMTRYNSFVLNNVKYFNEDYVFIANDATIESQKTPSKDSERQSASQATDYWVAKILEVRALDEHHVYARVYWMYSPDELPANTLDGKKLVSGRQPYHGQNELIASNHMDVINVVSVASRAVVNQWVESDDEDVQDALYWRQAFDCRTSQLSSVELTCKCQTPANPDKTLVGCTSSGCEVWLHYDCLYHDVLMRTFERLGTNKPHLSSESGDHSKNNTTAQQRDATKPSAGSGSATPADIKSEDASAQPPPVGGIKDTRNGDSMAAAAATKQIGAMTPKATDSPAPGKSTPAITDKPPRTSSAKRGRPKKTVESKPYEGLFEATLKLDDGPTVWQISDLRVNVTGGDRDWTERAQCLICGNEID